MGVPPKNHPFIDGFSILSHPAIKGYPYFYRTPPSDAAAWPQHRNFGLQNAAKVCLTDDPSVR